ncbi:MAG: hypothetical protein HeimC3_20680 [Candidatus Heimdallarchaeota archaeon LC_3]|nr:MAG: hypothetical protein HeimC3_20680 [Candidatus Heimdallarchaeota archaeon LC_3]
MLIIEYGLFLSILLAPIFNKNYFELYSALKIGEIVRVTKEELISLM